MLTVLMGLNLGCASSMARAHPGDPASTTARAWNIISIVTDDQALWAMGAYGNPEAVTPNMDRLAREGMRFTNAFAASAVCTPSRVSILTGLYASQLGTLQDAFQILPTEGLPVRAPSWPAILQQHGYATGLVGKWHLGDNSASHPTRHGYGVYEPGPPYYGDRRPQDVTDQQTDLAIQFIRKNQHQLFALSLHYNAPHLPYGPVPQADTDAVARIDPKAPPIAAAGIDGLQPVYERYIKGQLRAYYAAVHSVDRNLGRLLAELERLKLNERTIIIFQSDQGYMIGHMGGLMDKIGLPVFSELYDAGGPRRWPTLVNLFDVTLRIPFVVRWPGVARPGSVNEELVSNIDTFRTILNMAGIEAPSAIAAEGRDLSPLLRGRKVSWREVLFAEYTSEEVGNVEFIRMARTRDWKLVHTFLNVGGNGFYDLKSDPGEQRNLYYDDAAATRHAPILEKLDSQLRAWQTAITDPALPLQELYDRLKSSARRVFE